MRIIGKAGLKWIKDRKKLIAKSLDEGRISFIFGTIQGICEICKEWKELDPDHIVSRGRGGNNNPENIQWICRDCHEEKHSMNKKEKKERLKKSFSNIKHKCISCNQQTRFLLCEWCNRLSVKR